MVIARQHLRRDVLEEVLDRLVNDQLPAGRINESELSLELGISRTPLREALLVLEQRGLLESSMGRGFRVRPLNIEEASELYPLLAVLEPMLVQCSSAALVALAPQLHAVLDQMAAARDAERLLELSGDWSKLLHQACSNRKLRLILEDLHRLAARYERANIRALNLADGLVQAEVVAAHRAIVDALVAGDLQQAGARLAATWHACLAALQTGLPAPGSTS